MFKTAYVPTTPATSIDGGMVIVHINGQDIYAPRHVAREFAERLIRQLDQADRESTGNVAYICRSGG